MGLILACRGLAVLLEGIPADGGLVHGKTGFMASTCSLALGFFFIDTLHTLNLYVTFGVVEETLLVHHLLGLALYAVTLASDAYLYLAAIVLIQVSPSALYYFFLLAVPNPALCILGRNSPRR